MLCAKEAVLDIRVGSYSEYIQVPEQYLTGEQSAIHIQYEHTGIQE
jgi:hypothetical protein